MGADEFPECKPAIQIVEMRTIAAASNPDRITGYSALCHSQYSSSSSSECLLFSPSIQVNCLDKLIVPIYIILERSRVRLSARRPIILNDFYVVFIVSSRDMLRLTGHDRNRSKSSYHSAANSLLKASLNNPRISYSRNTTHSYETSHNRSRNTSWI